MLFDVDSSWLTVALTRTTCAVSQRSVKVRKGLIEAVIMLFVLLLQHLPASCYMQQLQLHACLSDTSQSSAAELGLSDDSAAAYGSVSDSPKPSSDTHSASRLV